MQIYVSGNVRRSGDGSMEHPFRTIQEAANVAQPGDDVLVAPGIYREWVRPKNSGTEKDRIKYVSMSKGEAIITGAERLTGWEKFENLYRVRIPNSFFGDYNPYTDVVFGDWFSVSANNPHTGDIYLDYKSMYEVFDLSVCMHPEKDKRSWDPDFTTYVWFTAQEDGNTVIYANFQGRDPNEENVEFAVRRSCFFPDRTGISNITFRGFTVRCAATQWAPPTAMQMGMVGPHWSKGWIIEDCDIYESKCCGISLGKYFQKGSNNKWSTTFVKDGTQTQRDAVCQAVNEGWDKETVGSHIVRRCDIHDCGQTGIVGHMGGAFSVIEDNHIHHINNKHNLAGAEIGGIKLHAAIDTIIRRNHIEHCTRGIWLDWEAQGTRVTQNFLHDNVPPKGVIIDDGLSLGEDIFIEVSHGPTLIDHNLMLSEMAARLSTQGMAFVHNLIAGSFTWVGNGTGNFSKKVPRERFTPYHVPHSTKIAGFMTILHGDVRFYNNIFVQKEVRQDLLDYCVEKNMDTMDMGNFICGTSVYNNYPTPSEYFSGFKKSMFSEEGGGDNYFAHLPVYTGGNAYYNGARPCDHELAAHVDKDHKISLYLDDSDGRYTIHTNLYEYLPRSFTMPINTEVLGVAFEPEQRFENPDGSSIMFDIDYFGRKRGIHPVAGPFEECNTDRFTVTDEFGCYRLSHRERARIEGAWEEPEESLDDDSEITGAEGDGRQESRESPDIPEPGDEPEVINANIMLTGCDNVGISFPFEGSLFRVRDMFVKGNEVWLYDGNSDKLVELDCEYGIYRSLRKWSVGALQSIDVSDDPNCEGFVRTAGTLLCILSKNLANDPADTCSTIQDKVNAGIEGKGIKMRFTTRYLKFIRGKKFISLEDVIYRMSKAGMDIVTERLEKL